MPFLTDVGRMPTSFSRSMLHNTENGVLRVLSSDDVVTCLNNQDGYDKVTPCNRERRFKPQLSIFRPSTTRDTSSREPPASTGWFAAVRTGSLKVEHHHHLAEACCYVRCVSWLFGASVAWRRSPALFVIMPMVKW